MTNQNKSAAYEDLNCAFTDKLGNYSLVSVVSFYKVNSNLNFTVCTVLHSEAKCRFSVRNSHFRCSYE